ncbi:MAG TPA: hypothetical protein VGO62_01860 [Myxococcota bacterium]|jgi:tetratricopeptide (TPR) repeat protein
MKNTIAWITTVALAACASVDAGSPSARAKVGRRAPAVTASASGWTEVITPHLIIHTDLSAQKAGERGVEFEKLFSSVLDLGFKSQTPPVDPIEVILFRNNDDFHAFAPTKWAGGYTTFFDDQPRLVFPAEIGEQERSTFRHELTHRFVAYFIPGSPTWLNEGMACFYETMTVVRSEATIGESKFNFSRTATGVGRGNLIDIESLPSASALVAMSPSQFYSKSASDVDKSYAASWLLVSMLMTGPDDDRTRFWSYLKSIAQGAVPKEAWRASFSGVDLDSALHEYGKKGRIGVARVPYRPTVLDADSFQVRAMGEDDVHILFATLSRGNKARANSEIDKALAAAPKSANAQYWAGRFAVMSQDSAAAEEHFKNAVALAPDDPRDVYALAELLFTAELAKPESERNLAALQPQIDIIARLDKSSSAQNTVAWYYAITHQPDQGMPFAVRSLQLKPLCWECLDTAALLTFEKGDAAGAAVIERKAIGVFPHGAPKELLQALAKYEAQANPPQQ